MLESSSRYLVASQEFMGKAYQYLAENDLRQASEKGWGAAAEIVKAVAAERGWPHDTHRLLYDAIHNLERETEDNQLFSLFQMASGLHINFYENWLHPENIRLSLRDVQQLISKLEPLLDGE